MAELRIGEAIIGVVAYASTRPDGSMVLGIQGQDDLTREVILPRPPSHADRLEWAERQHEYEATLAAFDRLHARRERRRALRWLRPWPLASAGYQA